MKNVKDVVVVPDAQFALTRLEFLNLSNLNIVCMMLWQPPIQISATITFYFLALGFNYCFFLIVSFFAYDARDIPNNIGYPHIA
jgi:hypothetical protein